MLNCTSSGATYQRHHYVTYLSLKETEIDRFRVFNRKKKQCPVKQTPK